MRERRIAAGSLLDMLMEHTGAVWSMIVSLDRTLLAYGSRDVVVRPLETP
ncbi:MAG: hypothetical protein GTO18_18460 [Anaerolineales bacterium]|nr:hypothetical protein [Anaerolineales bacterium]